MPVGSQSVDGRAEALAEALGFGGDAGMLMAVFGLDRLPTLAPAGGSIVGIATRSSRVSDGLREWWLFDSSLTDAHAAFVSAATHAYPGFETSESTSTSDGRASLAVSLTNPSFGDPTLPVDVSLQFTELADGIMLAVIDTMFSPVDVQPLAVAPPLFDSLIGTVDEIATAVGMARVAWSIDAEPSGLSTARKVTRSLSISFEIDNGYAGVVDAIAALVPDAERSDGATSTTFDLADGSSWFVAAPNLPSDPVVVLWSGVA